MNADMNLTKMKIARAALTLFVARGVAETTTKEIAKAAGISEGAIYRHYPSKDELAWSLFEGVHARLADLVSEAAAGEGRPLSERVARVVAAYCATADQDWLLFTYHLLNQHHMLPRFGKTRPNPVDAVKRALEAAMEAGEIAQGDAEVLTNVVLGVVVQPAISKAYGRWEGALSDHAALFVSSICRLLTISEPTNTRTEEAFQ